MRCLQPTDAAAPQSLSNFHIKVSYGNVKPQQRASCEFQLSTPSWPEAGYEFRGNCGGDFGGGNS